MKQLALDIIQPPPPTLDNYVTGRNAEALAHVRAALAGSGERFLYLWGVAGSGRTHVLRAAAAAAGGTYIVCGENTLFDDPAAMLAADDVGRLGMRAQEALFHRYNRLRDGGGMLIASGIEPPARLTLRADLVTRLAWGLVMEMHALTDDEKSLALKQHAQARGLKLGDGVIAYLLTHAPRGMGELYALLDALDRASLESRRAVTVAMLREMLNSK